MDMALRAAFNQLYGYPEIRNRVMARMHDKLVRPISANHIIVTRATIQNIVTSPIQTNPSQIASVVLFASKPSPLRGPLSPRIFTDFPILGHAVTPITQAP